MAGRGFLEDMPLVVAAADRTAAAAGGIAVEVAATLAVAFLQNYSAAAECPQNCVGCLIRIG